MFYKAILIWVLIAIAETLHGIARVAILNRRIGDRRARQISVLTGSAIVLMIAWVSIPWIGVATVRQCLEIGLLWLSLMLAFDLGLGRLYFRLPWKRLLSDFDPRRCGFLGFGMFVSFLAPLIVARSRSML